MIVSEFSVKCSAQFLLHFFLFDEVLHYWKMIICLGLCFDAAICLCDWNEFKVSSESTKTM